MTCTLCELAQAARDAHAEETRYYIRIKEANVEIVGCPAHAAIVVGAFRLHSDYADDPDDRGR